MAKNYRESTRVLNPRRARQLLKKKNIPQELRDECEKLLLRVKMDSMEEATDELD